MVLVAPQDVAPQKDSVSPQDVAHLDVGQLDSVPQDVGRRDAD